MGLGAGTFGTRCGKGGGHFVRGAEKSLLPSVALLVFTVGFSFGTRQPFTWELGLLALKAFFLAAAAMVGSAFMAVFVQHFLFRRLFRLRDTPLFATEGARLSFSRAGLGRELLVSMLPIGGALLLGAGVAWSGLVLIPRSWVQGLIGYAIFLVVFFSGAAIGADRAVWINFRKAGPFILLLPLSNVIGTIAGALFVVLFLPGMDVREAIAACSGFGYYTLSSVLVGMYAGPTLALVTLLVNLLRETMSIALSPGIARVFGPLGPIATAGASSMNSALGVISLCSGRQYAFLAVVNGVVLSLMVPILITLIFS